MSREFDDVLKERCRIAASHRQKLNDNHRRRLASLSPTVPTAASRGGSSSERFSGSRGRSLGGGAISQWRSRVGLPSPSPVAMGGMGDATEEDEDGVGPNGAAITALMGSRPELRRCLTSWVKGYAPGVNLDLDGRGSERDARGLFAVAWDRWRKNFETSYDPLDAAFEAAYRNYTTTAAAASAAAEEEEEEEEEVVVVDRTQNKQAGEVPKRACLPSSVLLSPHPTVLSCCSRPKNKTERGQPLRGLRRLSWRWLTG